MNKRWGIKKGEKTKYGLIHVRKEFKAKLEFLQKEHGFKKLRDLLEYMYDTMTEHNAISLTDENYEKLKQLKGNSTFNDVISYMLNDVVNK